MKLTIEFPMHIVSAYHGKDNLDETMDENISYLIGKYCYDHQIDFKILSLDFIDAQPNVNDELVRYIVAIDTTSAPFKNEWILDELTKNGYEKGLTIKSEDGQILYADEYTADIQYRRTLLP